MAPLHPLRTLLFASTGWVRRHQAEVIEYLIEENRVMKEQMQERSLRLYDGQRSRLAAKTEVLDRKSLERVATIVTPDTLLRWHRQLIALKWIHQRNGSGRPTVMRMIRELIVRMATENSTWGYARIQSAGCGTCAGSSRNDALGVAAARVEAATGRASGIAWTLRRMCSHSAVRVRTAVCGLLLVGPNVLCALPAATQGGPLVPAAISARAHTAFEDDPLLLEGEALSREGQLGLAQQRFELLLTREPGHPLALWHHTSFHAEFLPEEVALERFTRAVAGLRERLRALPDKGPLLFRVRDMADRDKQYGALLWDVVVEFTPDDLDAEMQAVFAHSTHSKSIADLAPLLARVDRAMKSLAARAGRSAAQRAKVRQWALSWARGRHQLSGQSHLARRILEHLVQADPDDIEALVLRKESHYWATDPALATGDNDEVCEQLAGQDAELVMQAFTRLVERNPRSIDHLIGALDLVGDLDEFAEHAESLVTIAPQDPRAWWRRGKFFHFRPERDPTSSYRKALELDPRFEPAHLGLAEFEEGRLDWAAARDHWSRLIEIDPQRAQFHMRRATAQRRLGEHAKSWLKQDASAADAEPIAQDFLDAAEDYARALPLSGLRVDDDPLGDFVVCVESAIELRLRGLPRVYDAALSLCEDLSARHPEMPALHTLRARLLVERNWNDPEVSLPALSLAAELDRGSNARMIGLFEALAERWKPRHELAVFAADFAERMAIDRTPWEAAAWLNRAAQASQALSDVRRQIACLDRAIALAPDDLGLRFERARAQRASNPEAGLSDMDAVLQRDLDNTDALALRGELLLAVGRPDAAIADLERFFTFRRPEWDPEAHALLESARARLVELAALTKAIAEQPTSAEPRLKRAAFLGAMGGRREAVVDLSSAIELLPPEQLASPLRDRAQHLTALEDWAAALPDWSRLVELDPNVPAHHLGCARALFELGRHVEALPACNRAVELEPREMRHYALRADCQRALGNIQAALDDTIEAYMLGEPTREQWFKLATELEARQQFDAALSCLRRTRGFPSESLVPSDRQDSCEAIARIYARRGVSDWEETEEREWRLQFLAQSARLNEHRRNAEASAIVRVFLRRGWQVFNGGDFNAAHGLATQALELDPYDTATLNLTIFSLRKLGRREESIAYIYRLQTGECDPKFEEARASAWARVFDNQYDEAQIDFEEAMRLCPAQRASLNIEIQRASAHEKAWRAHKLVRSAEEAANRGDVSEAFGLYDQAVTLAPHDETILNGRARLILTHRGIDAAEIEYLRMQRADPSSFYANIGLDYIRQLRNNARLQLLDEEAGARRAAPAPERTGGGCSGCSGAAGSRNYWNSSWVPLGGSSSDAIYFRCYSCGAVGSPY